MKLEDQVVSLELAKELKALGVKRESAFYWMLSNIDGQWKITDTVFYEKTTMLLIKEQPERIVPAFTVAELGEILPGRLRFETDDVWLWTTTDKYNGFWEVRYRTAGGYEFKETPRQQAKTEADARAKMICYLIKTGVVTP